MKRKIAKKYLKQQNLDISRPLRVIKYIECPFILNDSPVELEEGFIVSDKDTFEVFACFIFKNVGERPIKKLDISIVLYLNQNIPYKTIDFSYSADELKFGIISKNGEDMKLRDANQKTYISKSECFGSCVFIPIPETYFTKMEVFLTSVQYINNDVENLNIIVAGEGKKYSDLDNTSKLVYSRLNIYVAAEERFPTKVVPQFSSRVWLCCCGEKNPIANIKCEKCGREKEWQQNSVTEAALEDSKNRMMADAQDRLIHDKTNYVQNKFLENEEDTKRKIQQYEKAMENIALEEKRRERNMMMALPKALLWIVGVYLIASLLEFIAFGTGFFRMIVNSFREIYNIITYNFGAGT